MDKENHDCCGVIQHLYAMKENPSSRHPHIAKPRACRALVPYLPRGNHGEEQFSTLLSTRADEYFNLETPGPSEIPSILGGEPVGATKLWWTSDLPDHRSALSARTGGQKSETR
jgi:hypothetical protein